MPSTRAHFDIDDAKSFDDNLAAFIDSLGAVDAALASAMKTEFGRLLRGEIDRPAFWDALLAAANGSQQP